jgi:hypothetical protein
MPRWLVALAIACAQPRSTYTLATDDDQHPQPIVIDELGRGEARVKAADEGAWWFRLEWRELPVPTGRVTISARVVRAFRSSVQIRAIEGSKTHDGSIDSAESRVVLAERATPRVILVRVSTSGRAEFVVTTSRDDDPLPEEPKPTCDLDRLQHPRLLRSQMRFR